MAVLVGDGAARAGEIRIERRRMLIDDVDITAAGIGLPDFNQHVRHRAAILVEHLAVDDDALAERLACGLLGEIGIAVLHRVVAVHRAGQFGQRMRHDDERL
jgi:hypothetical protein